MNEPAKKLKVTIVHSLIILAAVMTITGTWFCTQAFAATSETVTVLAAAEPVIQAPLSAETAGVAKFGFIAAAAAFGLGAIGAGVAIAYVGAAAMGAVAEKPEIAGQALIFVALAEGIVVFGFITALMILGKV